MQDLCSPSQRQSGAAISPLAGRWGLVTTEMTDLSV